MPNLSPLQKERLKYEPKLPKALEHVGKLKLAKGKSREKSFTTLPQLFPILSKQEPFVTFDSGGNVQHGPLRIGVVLSGGQAAGGHNVITGLFDALHKLNLSSQLFGFSDGPKGIVEQKYKELTAQLLAPYRNQGGFDMIGSGRTKIETEEQFQAAEACVRALKLDGLVVIGGDDSNTNAALLAEYFLKKNCPTTVVGVPKTIDGDLANADIEISFGFDTATKTYSETIGNIARDALSAKKYYYFIKLMGRSASNIALECALQTQPNMVLIGEEVAAKQQTLQQVTTEICDLICQRAEKGKDYGIILIPEGIIEFIPEFRVLISELNSLLAGSSDAKNIEQKLTAASRSCFQALPKETQMQLLLDRDPHGNVQVSKIETERMFQETVQRELEQRQAAGRYKGKFSAQPEFCGYEGRSALPTNFDAQYCYALGHVAALLVAAKCTGYIACVQGLTEPVEKWRIGGRNLVTMMSMEKRKGKEKPVIGKALVDLQGKPFARLQKERSKWCVDDFYLNSGPIQFFGPAHITDSVPLIILER